MQSGLTPLECIKLVATILGGRQWRGKLQNRKKNADCLEEIYIPRFATEMARPLICRSQGRYHERIKIEAHEKRIYFHREHELRTADFDPARWR